MIAAKDSSTANAKDPGATGCSGAGGSDITRLLQQWRNGNAAAADALMPLVYRELHTLARRLLRHRVGAPPLQATELIGEVWLRLDQAELGAEHRRHFMALSARVMRQILVDHARRRHADKRGGGWLQLTLSHAGASDPMRDPLELLALDEALTRLATLYPRAAHAVELHYFAGLTTAELAQQLEVTTRTVERDLRFSRAWLKDQLCEH